MKIVKRCAYCSTNYNLLPTILLTPLYGIVEGWPYRTKVELLEGVKVIMSPTHGTIHVRDGANWWFAGFRIAFKFWRFHYGLEVHYG